MKVYLSALAVLILCSVPEFRAQDKVEELLPAGAIDMLNAPAWMLLDMYDGISGGVLIVSSDVKKKGWTVTLQLKGPQRKAEALKAIERALLEQNGIVITPLDRNRISVTHNDAWPIKMITAPQ
jgi:hypothetical protein